MVWEGNTTVLTEMVDAGSPEATQIDADEMLGRWQFTFISPSIERVLGYRVEEGMRLRPKELLTPASYAILKNTLIQELAIEQTGKGDPARQQTLELEHIIRGGKRRWCEITVKFLRDETERIIGIVGSTRDITERKRFERELSEITTHQQQRMGQELHDGLGQQLLGLRLMTTGLQESLDAKGLPEAESASELATALDDAQNSIRALIKGIRPVEVDGAGLMAALADLANSTQQLADVICTFKCDELVHLEDNHTATQLFHIAQEAVRNAVKHASAEYVTIGLRQEDRQLRLWVHDDGIGMPPEPDKNAGMGLRILRYRVGIIGAALTIESAEVGGTLVTCILPLEQIR
jgi:PAS domain S-box-containing protein